MRKTFFILGWLLSFLLPLNIITSEMGTCTQGSTDEFLITNIYSIFILIFFIFSVNTGYRKYYRLWWLSLYHILTAVIAMLYLPKYFLYTTIKGISPCIVLNDFSAIRENNYLQHAWQSTFSFENILFAPIEITVILIIFVYGYIMYRQKKKNNT